jgi:chemotaxis protein MotD
MMNIVGTGAADAAASSNLSSTSKKGADKGEGFSDAMSEFDKDAVGSKAGAKQAADDGNSAEQDAAAEDVQAKPKPIIDIRPESLRKPTMAQAQSALLQQQQTASAKDILAQDVAGRETTRELTAGEKKLKEALAAAKALTAKADALEGKDGSETDDIDLDKLLSKDDGDVELSDILSLLSGHGATAALEGMAPAQKGQMASGKQGKADGDTVRGKSDVASAINALSGKVADTDIPAVPGTEVKVDQDRLFRFQDAKGERQSMDMRVGDGRSERVTERSAAGGQAETVNVLDSRRFLGLAPNASALTSALSGDSEWVSAMQSSSSAQNVAAQNTTGGVVNTLKLQMTPHDLGSVTAMLRLQGEQLNVHLTVETRAAYRQLSDDSGGILDALRSQGFAVDQVTISIAPTADSDAASNQQNGQQASAQGEKQGGADRGQENASGRQFSQQAAGNGNEGVQENQAGSASGGARSGQLYL